MSTNLQEIQTRVGVQPAQQVSSLSVESDRATALVRTAYQVAKMFPRNINQSVNRIKEICQVFEVAVDAEYQYQRGGKLIQGGNIRIAEIIADNWGNIVYGGKELIRGDGESLVEAYCRDLETNVERSIQIIVPHRRDKSEGGKDLESDRDIAEMVKNQVARNVREMIFSIVPHFAVQAAIDTCRATVKKADSKKPLKERIKDLLPAFEELGVTVVMLRKWLKCAPEEMLEHQFQQLRRIYPSIRDGQMRKEDFFEVDEVPPVGAKPAGTKPLDPSNAHDGKPAAQPAEDADKQIPHGSENKPVESDNKKADPENSAPTYEDIKAKIEAAASGDAASDALSLINKNPNVSKVQAKELRELAIAKVQALE